MSRLNVRMFFVFVLLLSTGVGRTRKGSEIANLREMAGMRESNDSRDGDVQSQLIRASYSSDAAVVMCSSRAG